MWLHRLRGWLCGLWTGLVLCVAGVAAPSLFAVLERAQAGVAAARLFRIEATLSLIVAVVLLIIERQVAHARPEGVPATSRVSTELLLLLGVLFCTVAGYFALQPLMEQARAGQGSWSFATLHGVSSVFFAAKGVLLLTLSWRCTAR